MSVSRRLLLRTGAASLVIFGAGGVWLTRQTAQTAREPWRDAASGFGDPRLDALAYAILAPNPHNMQPWRVKLDEELAFTLYADISRLLPETDPPARQISIGFGCFLELFRQAAAQRGYRAEVSAFPEGEPQPSLDQRPVARVRMVADTAVDPDPLFGVLLKRHTQRAVFDTQRTVDGAVMTRVIEAAAAGVEVAGSVEPQQLATLRELTRDAWITEWENATTREETVVVTRIGKEEVNARPWGITLDGALMGALKVAGLISRDAMRTPGEVAYEQSLSMYSDACMSAMGHIWATTTGNTRRDQLNAGATWVRLHQAATREGLSFHPLSQALQEFPAMAAHYQRVHALLAAPGHTLQMLVRVGYGPDAGPSPREPLTSKLSVS